MTDLARPRLLPRLRVSSLKGRLLLGLALFLLLALGTAAFMFGPALAAISSYEPQEGDIIFQSLPHMPLVDAIEGTTQSPFSHCGIVAKEDGKWVVHEALSNVGPVSLTKFVLRGRQRHFAIYRLKAPHQRHVPATLAEVRRMAGRPYDYRYRMDDESIYCSELIFKAFQKAAGEDLGRLVRLGDLQWKPYEAIITTIERGPVPLDRRMITPRDLAQAPQLERVLSVGFD